MVNIPDSDFDEDAAFAALESIAARPRSAVEAEQERQLKGYLRDIALEKWGPDLEEMTMQDLQEMSRRGKRRTEVLPLRKSGK